MSGATSLLSVLMNSCHIKAPNFMNAVFFTLVFGGAVFWSTKITDYFNRGLISIKGGLLLATLALLLPHINISNLLELHGSLETKCFIGMIPIFLCAFGYHTVIPSLRMYLGEQPRELKLIIILGTTVS